MIDEILFASGNSGKLSEVRATAAEHGVRVLAPSDIGGAPPEVEESASDYLGNARLKAHAFFAWSGIPSLSDDTGLEVDALNGRPGVLSARYAGPSASPADNIAKLLGELHGATNRSARFYCVLYAILDERNHMTAEAVLEGEIAQAPRGGGGFGYDSVFVVRGTGRTLAELKHEGSPVETHRIKACRNLFTKLRDVPGTGVCS